ncbi:DUF4435 domain-containing protein [Breoghania sp. L-A4]|uniref:DUF4435 domain-containing protein n=1 Tax=Breoghania sp. L-A4 TaxID=2304600 RepID=UPI000E35EDA6|nr:DUF4435 domain-containing protein [Breoghania sp. L-A4]AXS39403.1 DUF4435 domain-containing protein [Breoghania sp. L-A4]
MSSVKDEITGQTLANQIMLEKASHSGSFLLVEGSSDASMFANFSDKKQCSIVVCIGWKNLFESISILSELQQTQILGYCDRDYSDIVGYSEYNGSIVFTDENDIETQIICSEALGKVLEEFGHTDRIAAEIDRENTSPSELVLQWSQATGALRLLSAQNRWKLKFKDMKYKFVDTNSPEFCIVQTVRYVVGRSVRDELPDLAAIETAVRSCIRNNGSRNLANGHDCVVVLGRAFRRRFGSTNRFNTDVGREDLAKILRIAYEFAFFQKTRGYREIKRWESVTGYSILRTT